ncbi:hypothetical protein Rvan_2770 [Rhodomicrobium vannielii ATCC 17100]|uniref:Uncharacterized protein n=1 Tax=Rhodomicrobium vannielii (strain ATCC 17100 / DSM 162 / LMG 4299 / NCIMB 10020 / ATH 3.1.1) TaxID=648757 RepID=E3I854_RHOVT|nr:hypothetical protein [Rhodomicrobium vannielii]ADP71980.1 hypothetical protein Rvan_2770 [Rhodomicrobium vannielii ATCC 17100]
MGLDPLKGAVAQARRDLHAALMVPALYLYAGAVTPVAIRVLRSDGWRGRVDGEYAGMADSTIKLVFMDFRPRKGAIVSVTPGEAYRIEVVLPPDGEKAVVAAVKLPTSEAAPLPVPA